MATAPGLLALDNLETPWLADPEAMEALLSRLARIPVLSLLATMRGATLASPDWQEEQVAPVDDATALAILNDYAPNIAADDPDWPAFRHALGGLPLAIALVGHRARTHHALAELWQDWQAQGTTIARRLGVEPGRLNALDHSIALSVQHASPPALRLFALLGQLPSGIADKDRRALLGADALPARDDLLRLGLAQAPPGRLDLLPPLRRYAQANQRPGPKDAAAWPRHYLALMAEEAERMRSNGAAAFARLAPELANIESVFAAAPPTEALPAVDGFRYLVVFCGVGSAAPLLALAQRCAEAGDAAGRARCLEEAGHIAEACYDLDTARARYDEALPLHRRAGSVLGEANCILSLGHIAEACHDLDTARARYDQALPLYRSASGLLGEANCTKSLGDIALRRSDFDTAGARYDEALTLYRRISNVLGEANCIHHLGRVAHDQGDTPSARTWHEAALALYRRIPEPFSIGWTHLNLANLPDAPDRDTHLAAAREAWLSINRTDLIAKHLDTPT
jgi:tetratricopeptide (TPR) repeat protein